MERPLFHICTIANDAVQYSAMRRSFEAMGFREPHARFSLLDNRTGNLHDPFRAVSLLLQQTPEPYLIFCHQDVRIDRGHGIAQLRAVLDELTRTDPHWAVAGNAGSTDDFELVLRITDPNSGGQWRGSLPQRVHSLDENFLILRTEAQPVCSRELSGFHFYATDLCLNAIGRGLTCYVVDFHLTHLSGGTFSPDYHAARIAFERRWRREFAFSFVRTTTALIFLSRFPPFRAVFARPRPAAWLLRRPWGRMLARPRIQARIPNP